MVFFWLRFVRDFIHFGKMPLGKRLADQQRQHKTRLGVYFHRCGLLADLTP